MPIQFTNMGRSTILRYLKWTDFQCRNWFYNSKLGQKWSTIIYDSEALGRKQTENSRELNVEPHMSSNS